MKCFSYKGGKINKGITQEGKLLETCAILVKFPESWDMPSFVESVRCRDTADIFLHACVNLVEGDSVTSVFPEGCAVVSFPCPVSFSNHRNAALELDVREDCVLAVLFPDSSVYDKDTEKYIANVAGKVQVHKDDPIPEDPETLEEHTHYIEF